MWSTVVCGVNMKPLSPCREYRFLFTIVFFGKRKNNTHKTFHILKMKAHFKKKWKWKLILKYILKIFQLTYLSPLWCTHWLWKPHLKNSKFDLWQLSFCIFLHKVFFFTLIRNLCTYMAEGTVIAVLYSKLMQIFHFSKNTYPFNMLRVLVLHYNLLINSKQPNV